MAGKLKHSITLQLGGWFLVIAVIPALLFISYYHTHITLEIEKKAFSQIKLLTAQSINAIEEYLKSARDDLLILSNEPMLSKYVLGENDNSYEIRTFFDYYLKLKYFKNIYLIDSSKKIILNTRDKNKDIIDLDIFIDQSPLLKTIDRISYFMQVEISNFEYSQLEDDFVSFIVLPIFKDGKIIGYLAVSMSEEMIFTKIFKYLIFNNNIDIFIGSKDYFKAIYLENEKLLKDDKKPFEVFEKTINGERIFENYVYKGNNFLLISSYLPSLRWSIVFRISIDKLENSFESNTSLIILICSIVFLIILSILLVVKFVSIPISKLIKQINLIENGNFDKKLSLDSKNEFAVVENSFNNMVYKLKDYKENLEEKVKSRTKELNDAKVELTKYKNELEKEVEREISKRREQEKLLIKQSKFTAVSEIISSIAHQWRQPLNAIAIMVMDLEYSYYNNALNKETIDEMVDKISSRLQYMSNTIDNFRDFFKMSNYGEFTLKNCFDSIISIVSVELNYYSINLVVDNRVDENVSLFGYENEFKQAILNILTNSKDAILDAKNHNLIREGKITISLFLYDKNIYIEITDNGSGIPNEVLEKIFLPYFSTKSQAVGIGLGLYLTKIVVDSMQGSVSATSRKLHTVFRITLPRRDYG